MQIVRYCPKCGNTDVGITKSCIFCNHETFDTKYTINDYLKGSLSVFKQKIIDEYASKSPEFDEELMKKRQQKEFDDIHGSMTNEQKSVLQNMGVIPNKDTLKCPICQSTDLSKISSLHKAGKILTFGIFGMDNNGKTWKCNNCGSKF